MNTILPCIVLRCYVLYTSRTSMCADTLSRIKMNSAGTPTRPTVLEEEPTAEITRLAKQCWNELPIDRPNSSFIRKTIRAVRVKW